MTSLAAQPSAPPLWRCFDDVPPGFGPSVVTLGVFDGVHRGHAHLIDHAVRAARARDLPAVVLTFDPHPAQVLGLPRDTARLSTLERRAALAFELGVQAVCALPFTREFAALSPAAFVERVLVERLRAEVVAVGANFTFGHRASGTVDTLRDLGRKHGFSTTSVDLLHELDARCSSTRVRECLRSGDLRGAEAALGRPHRVEGVLRPAGPGLSELVVVPDSALPAAGRYLGRLDGNRSVVLWVSGEGRVFVESAVGWDGRCEVDFIDRAGAR
ncbi:cytidyltransferase [Saccharopolyspora rhizosphaerae]|uniref:FAD synthase n=1 Tax=Saccharopolyspora rhizosphaerae TaxID=2492662 RepID=A0A3R8Q298_9PSEU|nr:cytidyltransferase [Saccharopolyspora rhizosphaerae]RRO16978.1 cytidyltransferase [Saccharopolyspora rhizosphaerae]